MKYFNSRFLMGLCFALFTTSTFAQEDPASAEPFNPAGSWAFSFGVEQVSFNKEQAASGEALIDDSATSLKLEGEYFFHSHYSTSFGLSIFLYDDLSPFSQTTKDSWGDYEDSSSDATGIPAHADVGYKRFFGNNASGYITLRLGISVMMSSERSISYCTDCYEEDIEIDGGFYSILGAGLRVGNSWLLGIHHQEYFSGDIERATGLNISYSFN